MAKAAITQAIAEKACGGVGEARGRGGGREEAKQGEQGSRGGGGGGGSQQRRRQTGLQRRCFRMRSATSQETCERESGIRGTIA